MGHAESSSEIIIKTLHDGHAWAIGVLCGGIAALDPTIIGFGWKLITAACMAVVTGCFYAFGGYLAKRIGSFFKKKE